MNPSRCRSVQRRQIFQHPELINKAEQHRDPQFLPEPKDHYAQYLLRAVVKVQSEWKYAIVFGDVQILTMAGL